MDDATSDRKRQQQLRRAWGEYLEGLPWDHYATLTFRRWSGEDFARRAFGSWARRLGQEAGMPLLWFVGFERGHQLGRLHLHALLGNTRDISRCFLEKTWVSGFSHIVPYLPSHGAAYYVTKYVTKELLEYDVSPNFARAIAARGRQLTIPGIPPHSGWR
jgi:hypothetical protein